MEKIKETDQVIAELKTLINSQGYIYALCMILFEDFHHDLNKIHLVDPRSKLSVKECSLILGFLLHNEMNFHYPESPEKVIEMKEKTYGVMEELHYSFNARQFEKFREMFEKQANGEQMEDSLEDRMDFFVKVSGMVEPMFYAGDGVYDFQYLEYLERKYRYDQVWLREHRNFEFQEAVEVVGKIKAFFHQKAELIHLLDLKEVFPEVAKKARKKLKKKYSREELDKVEREQFISASFYQYRALFPDPDSRQVELAEDWRQFYDNLVNMFIVSPQNLGADGAVSSFLDNFSVRPGGNHAYNGPGYFNQLNSTPIIKLSEERYFVPIGYLIPEAVYESPFYWMWEDKAYRPKLAKHRGDVGEEIAYDFLVKVFGKEHTFRSVLVKSSKGETVTDVDVLCLLGNKALCVQVKSKKLTMMARRGNFEQLSTDFKGAVQDAYDQGLISRTSILEGKFTFLDENGKELSRLKNTSISEIYILGLTTENYPALVHQVHMMLKKEEKDPFPLFVSAFDLELMVHYLPDPYDFLYYIRQRINLLDYFHADEELVYLGYHLSQKLCRLEGYDGGMLDTSYGANIDRNYYPFKTGQQHLLPEKDDPIHNRWKDPNFDEFIRNLKASGHSQLTDIVFHLLDWSGKSREDIVSAMIRTKTGSIRENTIRSIATASKPDFGVSYIVLNRVDPQELDERVNVYAELRKYASGCNAWLGMGAFSGSNKLIDFLVYLDEPWTFDPKMETATEEIRALQRSNTIPLGKNMRKIGRNEPCFCNSGLKYKKCCGSK
ncbi:SEC-C metal-binding domain-containing protein [Pedobacter nanyangensis]|uniref:SEC-C metal-binding domain-containing protein n=1 Tax=Pedobacter nanyangensis TaxID=1562389 RepID=UPI0013B3BE6D|nr:SEC-C metal-binding domain-containing protein [Pedobacter nanyangensis]